MASMTAAECWYYATSRRSGSLSALRGEGIAGGAARSCHPTCAPLLVAIRV